MLALLGWVHAELPPPDYRDQVLAQVEAEADRLLAEGRAAQALELVQTFRDQVEDDPRLVYEEGLALRLLGRTSEAEQALRLSVQQDPSLFYAWYDLGELELARGDLDAAERAFQHASEGSKDHPNGWAGPFRLAELAGRRGDPVAFDEHLREAVHRGFRFATVTPDPTWTGFLRDPALGEVLRRHLVVYGEEHLLEHWQ
jgi:tetratricopeptide (TPR) repeat protein